MPSNRTHTFSFRALKRIGPKRHPEAWAAILLCLAVSSLQAQRSRISGPIDNNRRVVLSGHLNPRALAGQDLGRIDPSTILPNVTLVLKQTPGQQADLEQLLADQQDPASANYHKWLTPEQYADRFGASQDDLDQMAAWLRQQNLTVTGVARGRNWIAFRGTAAQVESAFSIELHRYQAEGETHYANASEPSIPAAFQDLVGEIHGLSDFRLRAPRKIVRTLQLQPNDNSSRGGHNLAPDDISIIYDVKPLYDAGIDGSGQSIVVVGQTAIKLSDIQQYRSYFNLKANDPKVVLVPGLGDPGIVSGDLPEADLDLELSGAVARNASITYVYSGDVSDAAQYAVDQAVAPVLSMSYGLCEAETAASDARSQQSQARQANAQGMTWLAASGDTGAADCVDGTSRTDYGLSVDLPGSIPEVTGVGGTTFNEGGGNYWSSTNTANHASALSYIPETSWNDSALDGSPSSGGGGASVFFAKPTWQAGPGVPNDGARDAPDVALSASADHDGFVFYTGGSLGVVGGTSVGAPTFAGMVALLNQYLSSAGVQTIGGLGNINPKLYALAQVAPAAFHDITTGDNKVDPCPSRARSCDPTPIGYSAGPNYDQVTGLGSVDWYNLVSSWTTAGGAIARGTVSMTISSSDTAIPSNGSVTLTATLKAASGGTPTGSVTFSLGSTSLGVATVTGSAATLAVSGAKLAIGANSISASYSGDSSYNGSSASIGITVALPSSGAPSVSSASSAASFRPAYAPGMIVAVFGSQLSAVTESAQSVPLPTVMASVSAAVNGVAAPLYYISPGQLNIQIPCETALNATAQLTVRNNGQSATTTFRVVAAAPGIFVDSSGAPVPDTSAARGSLATLFITGEGALVPALATGATPSSSTPVGSLPKPSETVTLTVGGVTAPIEFIGVPWGLVGVTQINYQVPSTAPAGAQPVVVTVGGVASPAATLTVQ